MDTSCKPWVLAVIVLALLMTSTRATGSCMPGMSTPGITTPTGDIVLEEGTPLKINCTMNPSHEQAFGRNASDLTFYAGDTEVSPSHITTINETTIQLTVDNLAMAKYVYYCKLRQTKEDDALIKREHEKQLISVCLNKVIVGSKPEEVQNFTCISKNWESLQCNWSIKENPVKTKYRIFFNLPGRAGRRDECLHGTKRKTRFVNGLLPWNGTEQNVRNKVSCRNATDDIGPEYLFNATCPNDTDIKHNFCKWDTRSTPLYRQPYGYYYFTLTGMNDLGTVTFQPVKFHHYAHVVPSPPVNLEYDNLTSHSVDLSWGIPLPLPQFPPGLQHRVQYKCIWDEKDTWNIADTQSLNKRARNLTFHLGQLPYAYTNYTVQVLMMSSAAIERWSDPATLVIRTLGEEPGTSPKTDVGSFEIVDWFDGKRDVYIYWQQIPKYLQNGDNFEYKIIQEDETGEQKILTPNETSNSYAKIKALSKSSYKYKIYASNSIGMSEEPSVIMVPSHNAKILEPQSFTKIAFGNGVYELSWKLPQDYKKLENYTIFWCDSDRDRPYQCTGFLNWTHVPNDVNIKNITVPDDNKIYQFAISANTANSSSGIIWATCTVIHNKGIGKMKNVWVNKIGSTFIEIGWKLECSDRIGLVKGYRIFYCPIVSPHETNCRGSNKNTTVNGDAFDIHGNITDLMPYTTYRVSISVMSRGGEGLESDYKYVTTMESAPEAPYNLTISEVTNTSMLISWLPPRQTNGVLQYYDVFYNGNKTRVNAQGSESRTSVYLKDLASFINVTVYMIACTGSCSDRSEVVTVQTKVGNPGIIHTLGVERWNISQFLVAWRPPSQRGGQIQHYELCVHEEGVDRNQTHTFITTGMEYIVPVGDCKTDDIPRTYVFTVRAVNFDFSNNSLFGNWSDPEKHVICFDPGFTQQYVIIWTISSMVAFLMILTIWFYGKKCISCCKEMQDVEVKLPHELDTPRAIVKEHLPLDNRGPPPSDLNNKRQSSDLDPEEKGLLPKNERHGRNPSGDSSGCSSGHDSVSSSLTSNTQISSDSGADVDQQNGLPEYEGTTQGAWELFSSHSTARSTPNLALTAENEPREDARPDPSRYPYLVSCPSAGNLQTRHLPPDRASSYCKLGNDVTSSYCRVGASQDTPEPHRPQVPTKSGGYIQVSEIATHAAPSKGSGYLPHSIWSSPSKEASTSATVPSPPRATRNEEKEHPATQLEVILEQTERPRSVAESDPMKTNIYVKVGNTNNSPKAVVPPTPTLTPAAPGYVHVAVPCSNTSSPYVPHTLPTTAEPPGEGSSSSA